MRFKLIFVAIFVVYFGSIKAADIIVPLHDEAFDNENDVLDSDDLDSIFNAIKNIFKKDSKDSIESTKDNKQDSNKNIESNTTQTTIESTIQDSNQTTQDSNKNIESKKQDSKLTNIESSHHIKKSKKQDSKHKTHKTDSTKITESKTPNQPADNDRERSISLHYLNGYMRHSRFNIILNGAALEYNSLLTNRRNFDMVLTYQLNFSRVNLNPDRLSSNNWADSSNPSDTGSESIGGLNTESTFNDSLIFGTFGTLDVLFLQSQAGYHIFSSDFGYSVGFGGRSSGVSGAFIQSRGASQFDEHSLLLNVEYGYALKRGFYTLIPYVRVESYVFFPTSRARSNFKRQTDGGMNAILGLKNVWDGKWAEFGFEFGALSDLNLSGNSIGILGDGTIVYDSDGMSNGIFAKFSLGILRYKHFHLLASTNLGYMLSYYELNIQSDLSLMWRF